MAGLRGAGTVAEEESTWGFREGPLQRAQDCHPHSRDSLLLMEAAAGLAFWGGGGGSGGWGGELAAHPAKPGSPLPGLGPCGPGSHRQLFLALHHLSCLPSFQPFWWHPADAHIPARAELSA